MNELIVDTSKLEFNLNEIKKRIKTENYTIIAVVKGNGYGLGLIPYTKFLQKQGINFFAVATSKEAILLRESGIDDKIILLTPSTDKLEIENLINHNIIITIDSEESAILANDISKNLNKTITAHLKIDTGLSRYGFNYSSFDLIENTIKNCNNIFFEGIFSHLSNSLAADSSWSFKQYDRFLNLLDYLEKHNITFNLKHICNSSRIF